MFNSIRDSNHEATFPALMEPPPAKRQPCRRRSSSRCVATVRLSAYRRALVGGLYHGSGFSSALEDRTLPSLSWPLPSAMLANHGSQQATTLFGSPNTCFRHRVLGVVKGGILEHTKARFLSACFPPALVMEALSPTSMRVLKFSYALSWTPEQPESPPAPKTIGKTQAQRMARIPVVPAILRPQSAVAQPCPLLFAGPLSRLGERGLRTVTCNISRQCERCLGFPCFPPPCASPGDPQSS